MMTSSISEKLVQAYSFFKNGGHRRRAICCKIFVVNVSALLLKSRIQITEWRSCFYFSSCIGNHWENYYKFRDVERIPKALRAIHDQLREWQGGILMLDTDLPDTHMIIVFLLDYLVENSGYNIVSLDDCLQT